MEHKMNDDELLLSIGVQLDSLKKDLKKADVVISKFFDVDRNLDININFSKVRKQVEQFNSEQEKVLKNYYKNIEKYGDNSRKKELSELKKSILERHKYADELRRNSAKLEGKINRENYEYQKKLANAKFKRRLANIRRAERKEKESIERINKLAKQKSIEKTGFWDTLNGHRTTTFGHKVATTAEYATAGVALYKLAEAFRAVAQEAIAYDDAIYNNMSVLRTNRKQAEKLANTTRDLSISYGGSIKEIDDLALTLGRAGVEYKNLAKATKSAVELAKITGDSFGDAAKVMSTFIISFKYAGVSVDSIRDKLAYMANATKMSTEDLGTFSNYALQTAKTLNLSIDSIGVLASSFSNLGMNASTIGTQIRKLDVIFKGNSKNISGFWDIIGKSQDEFRKKLSDGKDKEAITELSKAIGKLSDEQFTYATRSMNIQERTLVSALRNADALGLISKHYTKINHALDATTQAQIKSLGATTMMERAWNSVKTSADGALTSILDIAGRKDVTDLAEKYNSLVEELSSLDEGTSKYKAKEKELDSVNKELKSSLDGIDEKFKSLGGTITSTAEVVAYFVGAGVLWKLANSRAVVSGINAIDTAFILLTTKINGTNAALVRFNKLSVFSKGGLIGVGALTFGYLIDSINQYARDLSGATEITDNFNKHLQDLETTKQAFKDNPIFVKQEKLANTILELEKYKNSLDGLEKIKKLYSKHDKTFGKYYGKVYSETKDKVDKLTKSIKKLKK